ncbi:MAG: hypothetical protein L6R36_006776 [Xanthoria steineri]|nr:MAG: hypothetical protein L6R36_006776 [Xanthoria steineri]
MTNTPSRKIVVFSGGSAANSLVDVFNGLMERNNCTLSYIIPISDNGGSSSELIRVFGGPGIGDIRSRLVRLIPPTNAPILHFFNHRLPPSPVQASAEFLTLLDLTSPLYQPIPTPQALLIRSIFSHLHLEILKRIRPPSSTFNFQSAAIGNLFLTGARLLTGSFESAIYLLAIIGGVDESRTAVLPAIVSNFTHHISAGLTDGTIITGQNAISHPSAPTALPESPNVPIHSHSAAQDPSATATFQPPQAGSKPPLQTHHPISAYPIEDATLPGSLPTLRASQLQFSKSADQPLPAPISRIWYINPYGQEMQPSPNPKAVAAIQASDAVIYSIGSLYTSLAPSLILQGIGNSIAHGPRFKILILNGSLDRETGGFEGIDFIKAVVRCCDASSSSSSSSSVAKDDQISNTNHEYTIKSRAKSYITHLIYIEHPSAPSVDRARLLAEWGIEGVRLYGRKGADDDKMRYDEKALGQVLGAILGRRDGRERSRRNTLEVG